MNNICVYIAGDNRIINQSIVTLKSVMDHNDDVDCMIFLPDLKEVTDEQIEICKRLKILIVGLGRIGLNYVDGMAPFLRWPKEIFLNYIAPVWLVSKGYKYAIKIDYDMLCIKKFQYEQILPCKDQVIGYCKKYGKITDYIDKDDMAKVEKDFAFKVDEKTGTANVGFLVFELESYARLKLADVLKNLFIYFTKNEIKIHGEIIEQFLFGLLQSVVEIRFKLLPYIYNGTASFTKYNDDWIIIHFNTEIKPWIDYKDFGAIANRFYNAGNDELRQLLLFNPWRKTCQKIGFKNFICPEPFSDYQIVKIYQHFAYFTFKESYRKLSVSGSDKAWGLTGIYDIGDEWKALHVTNVNVPVSKSNSNYFRYDMLKPNSIYTFAFITEKPRKFFTAGVFDFSVQRTVFFNEYQADTDVRCSFMTGDDVKGLAFLIYAGIHGDTAGKSLSIREMTVKIKPLG